MMVVLDEPLQLNAVRLIPIADKHASERYASWMNDPEVIRYTEILSGGYDIPRLHAYIASAQNDPVGAFFAIESETHGHVGNLRIGGISARHGRATIALLIGERSVWGRGIGSAAIQLATDFAFRKLHLRKLCAGIYEVNIGSRIAFERAGYIQEAKLKAHVIYEGRPIDVLQMAKFNGEFAI